MELRASSIVSLPPSKRQAFLDSLSQGELTHLEHDWHFWARDDQLAPPGIWRVWLTICGRGWGKTRVGAEWCHDRAALGPSRRIAIIAATKDDARKVCVEGDSGILATAKPWFRPGFEPSKNGGTVTWPNGSIAELYSGEKPSGLRGPQFHDAWCFPAGTLVAMVDGTQRPIDHVRFGEAVQTRLGARKVIAARLTRRNAPLLLIRFVDGRALQATPNHPLWIEGRGWTRADEISAGDVAWALQSNGTAASFGGKPRQATTSITTETDCIDWSMRSTSGRSRKASTSITRTRTQRTTRRAISSLYRMARISDCIALASGWAHRIRTRLGLDDLGMCESASRLNVSAAAIPSALAPGVSPESSVRQRAWSDIGVRLSSHAAAHACSVATSISHSELRKNSAQGSATTQPLSSASEPSLKYTAPNAGRGSRQPAPMHASAVDPAPSPSIRRLEVVAVERLARRADVYDLAVEGAHEFFANGVLVHNCDEMAKWTRMQDAWDMLEFSLRLGSDPRKIVTTTPTPAKLIKLLVAEARGDGDTRLTRGSTYANAANLAAPFLERLRTKYEGTRLGRQELHGEILEDKPGALWTLKRIEEARVAEHPPLQRVVVAVDPPTTSGEDADECGIVVAGLGRDGHAYVLADGSEQGLTPKQWAEKALGYYVLHEADRIVAETNQGGEMVENTIRQVDPNVPYRGVHAKKGKVTRAEPVSALYEQGRVHHVGVFSGLETQMTDFTSDFDADEAGYSPDRVDALVYAITELMLQPRGEPRITRI